MNLQEIASIAPSHRQLAWQRLGFYGFIHFGMNTMTNREWGEGHEDLSLFNPEKLDAREWVSLLRESGMQAVILTCKHHDGFCLWPSEYSAHTVANTPWRGGRGDLVKEVSDACREYGLKFGVYLSPWDRTESSYGEGKAYDDFYVSQLTELLRNYGEIGCVWLDGANGEGPSGKKQSYDWDRYYKVVRRCQPGCVISVCGPDIRWVGNEAGHTRVEEWSVVPGPLRDAEKTSEKSQQADDGQFSRSFNSMEEDLGSRRAIEAYDGEWVWYPAEVNTSIRPGWFYHAEEDDRVRSGKELFEIYLNSVGGNATFLLNVPPNARGEIARPDRDSLLDLGRRIAELHDESPSANARLAVSSTDRLTSVEAWLDGGFAHTSRPVDESQSNIFASDWDFWKPDTADAAPWLELTLSGETKVNAVVLREHIRLGQRIEAFEIWSESEEAAGFPADTKSWNRVASGTIVGYQRIVRLNRPVSGTIRIIFKAYRGFMTLAHVRPAHIRD
ncbi:alpha-L-fucosidase [Saccharibacillus sp. CPCC 101409]|uniref:alpha-L-fucosidase n=1 Tax=Saccharibacillus sp. CPCC 101409 TaxID=3058041 RepID=UPI002671B398|nr:alpha-L-fucosidase [Saccharibacillus sp. CPCC 101409]MDO3412262.1 alpha-L-fucosidase [Saccharibacillus sp. CPCC 101409]